MNRIQFSWEGADTLVKYANRLQDIYDIYCMCGKNLQTAFEEYASGIGYDADRVKDLTERLYEELNQNAKELLRLHEFCLREADLMAQLLSSGTVPAAESVHAEADSSRKLFSGRFPKTAEGKDLTGQIRSKAICLAKEAKELPYDGCTSRLQVIADRQGFLGKPMTADDTAFREAVMCTGTICVHTWEDGIDIHSQEWKKAEEYKSEFINSERFVHNGTGRKSYGVGLYMTSSMSASPGTMPDRRHAENARIGSLCYGSSGKRTAAYMTYSPNTRLMEGKALREQYKKLTQKERDLYADMGCYAAALGYDGVIWRGAGIDSDYVTFFNRSKLIVFDGTEDRIDDLFRDTV